MIEIATTGGIILDNIVAADGAVHLEMLGGNAVYSAAGARLWARSVACIGVVPRNYPTRWLDRLAAAGLDIRGVHRAEATVDAPEWFFHRPDGSRVDQLHAPSESLAAFGLSSDRISPDDARRFERWLRETSVAGGGFAAFRSAHPVEPDHLPDRVWAEARGLHLGPNRIDAQRRLARRARERGIVVSLDPGRQAEAILSGGLDALPDCCDVFLPSEKEMAVLCPGATPEVAVRRIAAEGGVLVAAKLGSRGSLVQPRGTEPPLHVPVLDVPAPDPTGAGDAYGGGFLAGLVRTGDPVFAALCGTVSASFAVEAFGPLRLLGAERAEVIERLRALLPHVPAAASAAGLSTLFSTEV